MADSESNRWVRITGALLIIAGVAVNADAVSWLSSDSANLHSGIVSWALLLLRAILVFAGLLLIARPHILSSAVKYQSVVVGSASVLALVGVISLVGARVSPSIDYRVASYPEFFCTETALFCNATREAGLRDVDRYGKGAAFADIDGDGWVDLYVADADPRLQETWGLSSFYLNNGDGSFRPVDIGIESEDLNSNWTGSFADMDNDGDPDLVLVSGGYAGVGRISLYENRMREEQRFIDISDWSGFDKVNEETYRWWGASWADYDGDGYLDFAISRVFGDVLLYRNNRDGSFTDVTEKMGISTKLADTRDGKNLVWFDYDQDGDLDFYMAGIQAHHLYENRDGQSFVDVTEKVFSKIFPPNQIYNAGAPVVFAAAAADFNQDGLEDLYLGRQVEQDLVLFNKGAGKFVSSGVDIGIDTNVMAKFSVRGKFENTMGLGVGDIFDDGWPDVIIGSGDPVRADEDVVFCNRGGTFERCSELFFANADGPLRTRTHGIAFADVDQNGFTDIYQSLGGHAPWDLLSGIESREPAALFLSNVTPSAHTATIILEGVKSSRDAIGARIKSVAEDTHYYTVRSTQAFQSQNEKAIILALGAADSAEVEVVWPSGIVTSALVSAGQRTVLREVETN